MRRRASSGMDAALRELSAATRAHREAVNEQLRATANLTTASAKTRRTALRVNAATDQWNRIMQAIEADRSAAGVQMVEAVYLGPSHRVRGIRFRQEGEESMEGEFGGRCTACNGYVVGGRCMVCQQPAAPPAPVELSPEEQQERDDEDRLRELLASLLTRTANALRGLPPPLVSWSWHDLPELADRLRSFVEELAADGCRFGDNCTPEAQRRHGQCLPCKARATLPDQTGEANAGTAA